MIEEGIAELITKEEIIPENTPEGEAIYLAPFYYAEVGVTNAVSRLLQTPANPVAVGFVDGSIDRLEKQMRIHFAANQREAIKTALTAKVMLLTGGPGTGKTTTTIGMPPPV